MARKELDRRLDALSASILVLGERVDEAIGRAMLALAQQDLAAAAAVITGDDEIDRARAAIEEFGAHLITLQQPAVRDLRAVLAAISIAEDLERIGDYAEGIARLAGRLRQVPHEQTMLALNGLCTLARVQLQSALDAYRAGDTTRASAVWCGDKAVDGLYERMVRTLMGAMTTDENELTTDTYLLWVAHNLERIADRASNICERVVFIATGEREIQAVAS